MENFIQYFNIDMVYPFLLLLARIFTFMAFMPVFGHLSIPMRLKVAFSFYLAIFLYPIVLLPANIVEDTLILALIGEVAIGFAASVILHIIFAAVKIAGELVSYSAALSMAQMFDPGTGTQVTLVSRFFDFIIIIFFFVTGLHEVMLMGVAKSFESIQLGVFALYKFDGIQIIIAELGRMMLFALSIALPVFFISMTMDMFFGYATRSMPQFSVFVVTFQLKFILIFFVMTYIISILVEKFKEYFLSIMFVNS